MMVQLREYRSIRSIFQKFIEPPGITLYFIWCPDRKICNIFFYPRWKLLARERGEYSTWVTQNEAKLLRKYSSRRLLLQLEYSYRISCFVGNRRVTRIIGINGSQLYKFAVRRTKVASRMVFIFNIRFQTWRGKTLYSSWYQLKLLE